MDFFLQNKQLHFFVYFDFNKKLLPIRKKYVKKWYIRNSESVVDMRSTRYLSPRRSASSIKCVDMIMVRLALCFISKFQMPLLENRMDLY